MSRCLISIFGTHPLSEKCCVYTFSNSDFPHGACSCWKPCCAHACLPPKSWIIWLKCTVLQYATLPLAHFGLKRLRYTPLVMSNCQTHTQRQWTMRRKTPWLSVGIWKHNLTDDKREVGGSPELVCGKASFYSWAGEEKAASFEDKCWWRWRYMLLIVLHVRWGGGGWISVGMGLKMEACSCFSAALMWTILLTESQCVVCPREVRRVLSRGESKPQPKASHISTQM